MAKSPTQLVRAVLSAAARFRDHDFTRDPSAVVEALDRAVDEYREWVNSTHQGQRAKRVNKAIETAANVTELQEPHP
jgi:hypothetical protein